MKKINNKKCYLKKGIHFYIINLKKSEFQDSFISIQNQIESNVYLISNEDENDNNSEENNRIFFFNSSNNQKEDDNVNDIQQFVNLSNNNNSIEDTNHLNNPNIISNNNINFQLVLNNHKDSFGETKTKEQSKFLFGRKKNKNEIIFEPKISKITRVPRDDNERIKIKRAVFNSFWKDINEKIKDENLKLNEFDKDKVKDMNISKDSLLGKNQWKNIILEYSNDNNEIIKIISDKNDKDINELLKMTFGEYLEKFKQNNLEHFLQKEKESQKRKYNQKIYKK